MRRGLSLWQPSDWTPFSDINYLQRNIDRLFDDFVGTRANRESMTFAPACDVQETDSHFLLSFDMPGLKKDDIQIEVENNTLTVSAERKREEERKDEEGYAVTERSFGKFHRSFTLPASMDSEKIEATYENGVLHLAVPKAEAAKARKIQIQEGKGNLFQRILGGKSESSSDSKRVAG